MLRPGAPIPRKAIVRERPGLRLARIGGYWVVERRSGGRRSWFSDGHEAEGAFSRIFSEPSTGSQIARSREPRAKREVPELRRDRTPTLTVRLEPSALRGIRTELGRSDGLLDCVETGGNLFGRRREGVMEITDASGPGTDGRARRFPDAVRVSTKEALEDEAALRRTWGTDDIFFLGGWHTHPIELREPSGPDRANALAALDNRDIGGANWIELILTADAVRGWDSAHVSGWATRRVSAFGAVTEPIVVTGRT
jgi:hypothetical protein